jgi:PAS domain S-box-containing protein
MPANWKITFGEFLDKMPLPGYLFDPENRRFVAANGSFCNLVGYEAQELLALEWPMIMADQGEAVRANEEISTRQGRHFSNQQLCIPKKRRYTHQHAHPISRHAGRGWKREYPPGVLRSCAYIAATDAFSSAPSKRNMRRSIHLP